MGGPARNHRGPGAGGALCGDGAGEAHRPGGPPGVGLGVVRFPAIPGGDRRPGTAHQPLKGDGTSRHYPLERRPPTLTRTCAVYFSAGSRPPTPSGMPAPSGPPTPSTGKPCSLVRHYQTQGVLGVDLEMAALFTVGRYRRVPVAGLLVVSDELATLPGARLPLGALPPGPGPGGPPGAGRGGPMGWRPCLTAPSWPWMWEAAPRTSSSGSRARPWKMRVKMVLPAPTQVLARRLRRLTAQGRPIFLNGRLMGGGAVTQAVRRHLAQGLPVYATPQAALTFSDRLELVAAVGGGPHRDPAAGGSDPFPGGRGSGRLRRCWRPLRSPSPAILPWRCKTTVFTPRGAIAASASSTGKIFWTRGGGSRTWPCAQPPGHFTRMLAVAETLPGALLMDTCAAGVRGALLDPQARERQEKA